MILYQAHNSNEVQAGLKKCKQPKWENTLYGHIHKRFEKELNSKTIQNINYDYTQGLKDKINNLTNIKDIRSKIFEQSTPKSEQQQQPQSFANPSRKSVQNSFNNTPLIKDNKHPQPSKNQNSQTQLSRRNTQISGGGLDRSLFQFMTNKNLPSGHLFQPTENITSHGENRDLSGKTGIFFNQNQQDDFRFDDGEEIETYQGQLIDEQYIPIPNKIYSIKLVTFFLNDYFTAISIQKDVYREKYSQVIEENKRTNKVLDQQFLNLNSLSVRSYRIIKQILKEHKQSNLQTTIETFKNEQEDKLFKSLLYSGYTIKQNIYNIFEWLNRKRNIYKEHIQKIDLEEELYGMERVFERLLSEQQIKLKIQITPKDQPLNAFTDERILNQILYNLISFCIQNSLTNSFINVSVTFLHKQSDTIQFSIVFKPYLMQNLSLLNYAELKDDTEDHYQQIIEVKICKHLLKFINPKGRLIFKQIEEHQIQIQFELDARSNYTENQQNEQKPNQTTLLMNSNFNVNQNPISLSPHSQLSNSFFLSYQQPHQKKSIPRQFQTFQETISENANSSLFNSKLSDGKKNQKDLWNRESSDPKSFELEKNYKLSQFYIPNSKKSDAALGVNESSEIPDLQNKYDPLSKDGFMNMSPQVYDSYYNPFILSERIYNQSIDQTTNQKQYFDQNNQNTSQNIEFLNNFKQSNYNLHQLVGYQNPEQIKLQVLYDKKTAEIQRQKSKEKQEKEINLNKQKSEIQSMDLCSVDFLSDDLDPSSNREIQKKYSYDYQKKGIKYIINYLENKNYNQDLQYPLSSSQFEIENTNKETNINKTQYSPFYQNNTYSNLEQQLQSLRKQKEQNYQNQKLIDYPSPRQELSESDDESSKEQQSIKSLEMIHELIQQND